MAPVQIPINSVLCERRPKPRSPVWPVKKPAFVQMHGQCKDLRVPRLLKNRLLAGQSTGSR